MCEQYQLKNGTQRSGSGSGGAGRTLTNNSEQEAFVASHFSCSTAATPAMATTTRGAARRRDKR